MSDVTRPKGIRVWDNIQRKIGHESPSWMVSVYVVLQNVGDVESLHAQRSTG